MRHHLLVPAFVAALVPLLTSGAAAASPVLSAAGTVDVSFNHGTGHNHPPASFAVTFPGAATVEWTGRDVDYGDAGLGQVRYDLAATDDGSVKHALAAVPEPDSAGVWAALAGLAALAASRPDKRKRKRPGPDA